jgi:Hemerythrin HHE cation binding domain
MSTAQATHAAAAGESTDAITLLRCEHVQTAELFEAYAAMVAQGAAGTTRRRLADLICKMLTVHERLETQLFYPVVREWLANPALLDTVLNDHVAIARLVTQLQASRPAQPGYDSSVARLGRLVQEHAGFEEEAVFAPLCRQGLGLQELGAVVLRWREHLLSADPTGARPAPH